MVLCVNILLKGPVAEMEHSMEHGREERSIPKDSTWLIRLPKERRAALCICQEVNSATFAFNSFHWTLGKHSRNPSTNNNNSNLYLLGISYVLINML